VHTARKNNNGLVIGCILQEKTTTAWSLGAYSKRGARERAKVGGGRCSRERERERERRGETEFAVGAAMKERCSKASAKTETVQLVQQLIIITYTSNKYLLYLVAVAIIIILITYVHNIAQVVTAAGMYVLTALSSSFITLHAHFHRHCYISFFLCFFQLHVTRVSMPITKHFASYD
jgi:hypothetical protein